MNFKEKNILIFFIILILGAVGFIGFEAINDSRKQKIIDNHISNFKNIYRPLRVNRSTHVSFSCERLLITQEAVNYVKTNDLLPIILNDKNLKADYVALEKNLEVLKNKCSEQQRLEKLASSNIHSIECYQSKENSFSGAWREKFIFEIQENSKAKLIEASIKYKAGSTSVKTLNVNTDLTSFKHEDGKVMFDWEISYDQEYMGKTKKYYRKVFSQVSLFSYSKYEAEYGNYSRQIQRWRDWNTRQKYNDIDPSIRTDSQLRLMFLAEPYEQTTANQQGYCKRFDNEIKN